MIIISAEIIDKICFLSPKRFEKNAGIVVAPMLSEYFLILLATNSQFKYVPIERPMAVQTASAQPVISARPGSPIKRYALISDASALIAVTSGPSFLPPR